MALRKSPSIPSRGARAALKRSPVTVTVEDVISHAVAKAQGGEVIYAADYLENKATGVSPQVALKLLLAAAQLIDSTNPNRARGILQRVLEIDPKCGPGHLGLAVVLSNLGDSRGSIERLRDAILLPLTAAQKILASVMLSKYGLLAPALDMAKKAFYELGKPLGQASNCLDIALQVADWDFAEELIEILREAHRTGKTLEANEATKTHVLWCDDEAINIEVIKAWSQRTFPDFKPKEKKITDNPEGRRLRVGYLSSDYRNHPTAWLVNGLFRNHDKSKFELFLYCSGWDDGSEIRKEVLSNFEHTHSVADLDDVAAAKLIDSHDLDILVELNGPTKANRMGILAHRPAPIQICYLGWPGSAGGRFIDYIIADEYILPQEQAKLYPEKIIWLSDTYQINDYAARPLPPAPSKKELGFAEDAIVVGMFNSINKVRREVWSAWMEIIKSCPKAVFWVLDPGPDARENLAKETLKAGLDLNRVVIAPKLHQMEHLRRLQACDLILDPWPVGGHTSAADAVYAGVPLIARIGKNFASRVNGSILRTAGLNELINDNVAEYVNFTNILISEPSTLIQLKKSMRETKSRTPLFDSTARTGEIEIFYENLAKTHFENFCNTSSVEAHSRASLLRELATGEVNKLVLPAQRRKFNICLVSPEGYSHHQAFTELAQLIACSLEDLLYSVSTKVNSLDSQATNILLGGHLLREEVVTQLPKSTIFINTEQLAAISGTRWATVIKRLAGHCVTWDYSLANLSEYAKWSLGAPKLLRLGYHEKLARIKENQSKDIDVLFYGSVTPRRAQLLQKISSSGLKLLSVFDCYGEERDNLIGRSSLVLNIHAYETKVLESVRLSYLMNNSVVVVSEFSGDTTYDLAYQGGFIPADLNNISTTCSSLLDKGDLAEIGRKALRTIQSIPQREIMESLLDS